LAQWLRESERNHLPGIFDRSLPEWHFTVDEAMQAVNRTGRTASIQQVADALKELGCIKHKNQKMIRGKRLRLWEAPKPEPLSPKPESLSKPERRMEEPNQLLDEAAKFWD
jgi:hypothetical protein